LYPLKLIFDHQNVIFKYFFLGYNFVTSETPAISKRVFETAFGSVQF